MGKLLDSGIGVNSAGRTVKLRVFVFEDNDSLRLTMSVLLENRGYEVLSFSEPGHCPLCLDRGCECPLGETCTDIILTDLNMPNMTGLEFLENRLRNGCKVKCRAVMSAGWGDGERDKANKLGCQTFEKPFRMRELDTWLGQCEEKTDPNRKLSSLPGLDRKRNDFDQDPLTNQDQARGEGA